MDKLKTTITFAIKLYLISIISFVVSMMIYFLGYAVTLVFVEGFLGIDSSIQTWIGIIAGVLAIFVFIAVYISLFYLGKIWQARLKKVVKFLVGLLSLLLALITIVLFAVYLASVS